MDLLTLLPNLEPYDREIVSSKTANGDAISYRGMTGATINDDTYENVNQICLLSDSTDLYLYVNYATRRAIQKYKLSIIETIEVT